jgi:hypothetical protein
MFLLNVGCQGHYVIEERSPYNHRCEDLDLYTIGETGLILNVPGLDTHSISLSINANFLSE